MDSANRGNVPPLFLLRPPLYHAPSLMSVQSVGVAPSNPSSHSPLTQSFSQPFLNGSVRVPRGEKLSSSLSRLSQTEVSDEPGSPQVLSFHERVTQSAHVRLANSNSRQMPQPQPLNQSLSNDPFENIGVKGAAVQFPVGGANLALRMAHPQVRRAFV